MIDYKKLITAAKKMQQNAHSRIFDFKVGAALLCDDGEIITGANVEFSTCLPSICAERMALANALLAGKKNFVAICVTSDSNDYCFPCGVCRQALVQYNENMEVIVAKNEEDFKTHKLSSLLPNAFKDIK